MIPYSYAMKRTTDATSEPVTTAEAKSWMRQASSTDDTMIDDIVKTARWWIEEFTGRALINQTWTQIIDWGFPSMIILPHAPLSSVTSIAYTDTAGDSQTLATTEYTVDTQTAPGRVFEAYSKSWPTTRFIRQAITVTYVSGYGSAASSVPEVFQTAIRMLAVYWYDNPEPYIVGATTSTMQNHLKALLTPYKVRC